MRLFKPHEYAFPFDVTSGSERDISPGMTLRDYFAGQALAGLMSDPNPPDPTWAANFAYRVADAMLKARQP